MHDWNDFTIADGILVDFAGAPTASQRRYTHYNLQTQTIVNNYYTGGATPRQAGITWNDTRYWVYNTIAVYNENGTIGPQTNITGATALDWFGYCGDATGFRPKSDFGDAPASFDPDPLSPALHEKDTALRLGPTWDQEFKKTHSLTADADGSDEDAISTVQILDTATTSFVANITVYNNTGQSARVGGWLDINSNGVFEAGEGRIVTVPHGGPVLQTVTLSWLSINSPLDVGGFTYLRIRVTRTSSGMTVNNHTGYYNNGEVEDYRVFVDALLPVTLIDFKVTPEAGTKLRLEWSSENESNIEHYLVQRSADGSNWATIDTIIARNQPGIQYYVHHDLDPLPGKSFYRLSIFNYQGQSEKFSQIRQVQLGKITKAKVIVLPNPVKERLQLNIESPIKTKGLIQLVDGSGRLLYSAEKNILEGPNYMSIPEVVNWPAGIYYIRINFGPTTVMEKFSLAK
jgi:hypothetical protein